MQSITIVGPGRVGRAIVAAGRKQKEALQLVHRGEHVSSQEKGPIWVCTTNDVLEDVFENVIPRQRYKDIVILQNGALHPFACRHGLILPGLPRKPEVHKTEDGIPITQVLLYAAALEDGSFKCGGRTKVSGPLSSHCADVLQAAGVQCQQVAGNILAAASVEKLLWASMAWLMSSALGGCKIGDVVTHHREDFTSLARELLQLATRDPMLTGAGVNMQGSTSPLATPGAVPAVLHTTRSTVPYGQVGEHEKSVIDFLMDEQSIVQGLIDYSLAIRDAVPSRHMAISEFKWRNGYFLERLQIERESKNADWSEDTLHEQWLRKASVL